MPAASTIGSKAGGRRNRERETEGRFARKKNDAARVIQTAESGGLVHAGAALDFGRPLHLHGTEQGAGSGLVPEDRPPVRAVQNHFALNTIAALLPWFEV